MERFYNVLLSICTTLNKIGGISEEPNKNRFTLFLFCSSLNLHYLCKQNDKL